MDLSRANWYPRNKGTTYWEGTMALRPWHALSLIRISFGFYLVVSALRKTTEGWLTSGEPVTGFVGRNLEASAAGYRGFLEAVVLPNADRFAQLILLGEWVAGLSLLFGFLTRLGALSGMWLVLNYMLAKGLPEFEGSQDRLFFVSCAVLGLSAAGLVWGLDGALRPYLSANPITRWLAGVPALPSEVRPDELERRRRAGERDRARRLG
jgi:uncharacterized membrane protein YphA (DoxX/SURF4 family)